MKQDIQWHKECLQERIALAGATQDIANLYVRLATKARREVAMYQAQIELAEKEGKTSFNAKKYAVERLKPIYELQDTV